MRLLSPPPHLPERTDGNVDKYYRRLRMQVFLGAFIGYAAFYIVRKNFSMAIPMLEPFGFHSGELGTALAMNAIAYALSKFLMGGVSDRSDARRFLPLGLILASVSMAFMVVPIRYIGAEHKGLAIFMLGTLNFMVGWFNGMGWPPCGRIMTHWFSRNERGTKMSVWNCAHNVGGSLIGPMSAYGAIWFGSWIYGAHKEYYFLAGTFLFPAATAMLIAVIAWVLLRDTPQSQGLPTIEKWRNDYPENYSAASEEVLPMREIFMKHVLNNRFIWFIALANSFVYMVRYGCLDWAPTLLSAKGIDIKSVGWAYFAYEFAAIPGTLICGWMSDKIFHGTRALPTIIFMGVVAVFICLYWAYIDNLTMVIVSLIGIGFFIYGPVMLIGVAALDHAPKNAAGTAAGLTGFFGYFFGTAILANTVIGYVAQNFGWSPTFAILLAGCFLAMFFMLCTLRKERQC